MPKDFRPWIRGALIYLTVSFLFVGLWATISPRSFYEDFPGAGRRWLAGDGPFNAHLAGDTGAGFLAVGVVLLLAAVWMERRLVVGACLAAAVHGAAHLLVHLREPNAALESVDVAVSNGSLLLGTVLAAAVAVVNRRAAPVTQKV